VAVLTAIDAGDWRGFADGVRPGRRPHAALEAVTGGIAKRSIHGVRAADMRGFCEASDHGWLVPCVAPRLGDRGVVRHRWTWRQAGVREAGTWRAPAAGTPPGGRVSPVAATSSLHAVLARWAARGRRRNARGERRLVRDGDDCGAGCAPRGAAERFWTALRARVQPCQLARPPEQTRLRAFGRGAADRRQRRGQGPAEPVACRGVTPSCRQTSQGKVTVRRQTLATRRRQTLPEVKAARRRCLHEPLPQQGAWLGRGLRGH
jgi:RNA-directed DNA polymerase